MEQNQLSTPDDNKIQLLEQRLANKKYIRKELTLIGGVCAVGLISAGLMYVGQNEIAGYGLLPLGFGLIFLGRWEIMRQYHVKEIKKLVDRQIQETRS